MPEIVATPYRGRRELAPSCQRQCHRCVAHQWWFGKRER